MKQYFAIVEVTKGRVSEVIAPYPTRELAREDAHKLSASNPEKRYTVKITKMPEMYRNPFKYNI